MPVIDVHTHMINDAWVEMLKKNGAPAYSVRRRPDGIEAIVEGGSFTMAFIPEMFDYDLRIKRMDEAGIDIAIISLTSPSVYWGTAEISAEAARTINDDMRNAQTTYPDRIRYLATLPWQYPELAVTELGRACDNGAVGVMVLANIRGMYLADPHLEPLWKEIDRRGLPVFVHPTTPPGIGEMDLANFRLLPTVGFTFDTTLAIARMVLDGFLDRFPNIKFIAAHGGGTLPYISSRIDLFFEHTPAEQRKISDLPSRYLRRIYYDAVLYQMDSLGQCINLGGADHVMFGTDYPHPNDIKGILRRINDLPPAQREALRGGNAKRLFAL